MKFSLTKSNVQIAEIEKMNETEKFQITNGHCFGDWGLLANQPRSASGLAIEDTFVISFDKEKYLATFGKSVAKANGLKVDFMRSSVKMFKDLSAEKFREHFKKIYTHFYNRNDCVYQEKAFGNKVFLIYQGSFDLMKTNRNGLKSRVLTLEKGEMAGIELLTGNLEYKFSLYVAF